MFSASKGGSASTISFVGSAKADATSVTLPTHVGGDIIIIVAMGESTSPSVPGTWTEIETGGSVKCAYKIASDGTTVSGTWTNAASIIAVAYRGSKALGDTAVATSSTDVLYPALTLSNSKSWVVGLSGAVEDIAKTPPTGMTNRSTEDNGSLVWIAVHDTAKSVSSWSQTAGGSGTGASRAFTVELLSY